MACSYAIGKWHVAVRLAGNMQPSSGWWHVARALAVDGLENTCGPVVCCWDGTKPGLWTLDWTMDWIMDSILDLIGH